MDQQIKIFYVTRNQGKLITAQTYLQPYGITIEQANLPLIEPQYDSIEQIVSSKVKQAYEILKEPCIAQDAGLEIESLLGFPGAYTEYVQRILGNTGLLKLLRGEKNRQAKFVRCLAYLGPNMKEPKFFHSNNPGVITIKETGLLQSYHWSKLIQIFRPNGYKTTLAALPEEEYHQVVRGQNQIPAEEQFAQWLTSL